jgi:PTS system nitrogen regulatory IIA component
MDEDFDVMSLAAYLHLTPDQVRKMASRDRLPGRRVGGKWRFSRAEIHQWFEQKIGASDEQGLTEVERVLYRTPGSSASAETRISELLRPETAFVPLMARTKRSVIKNICDLTAETGRLWDPVKMAEALTSREELHPTALGNGVALLHPRRPLPSIMGDPFLALGITTSGIPFGGPRGCLTDVFFLIGSTSEAVHLRVLAKLSRMLQQPEWLDELRESESPAGAWQVISDGDTRLD